MDTDTIVRVHAVADFDRLRTGSLRTLGGATRLLSDAQAALQAGDTHVVAEFLDRVLTSLHAEQASLRAATPCACVDCG